jgi:hypothetical protein
VEWWGNSSMLDPVLWTPANIPTSARKLFINPLDAATITTSGGLVTSLTTIESLTFTGASGTQPAYNLTGFNNAATIDYTADRLSSTATAASWNYLHNGTLVAIYMFAKPGIVADPNNAYWVLGTAGAGAQVGLGLLWDDRAASSRNNRVRHVVFNAGTAPIETNLAAYDNFLPANTYSILTIRSDPANATAANRSRMERNAGTTLAANAATGTPSAANAFGTLQIGNNPGSTTLPFTGGMGPILILSGADAHSTDYRQRFEGWIANEYYRKAGQAVPLPVGHPYYSAPPYV